MATVARYPIISYPMNQSGPFTELGKKVIEEVQFKNVNPEKSESKLLEVYPARYVFQTNETIRTT